jgi:hypothetical protein
VTEPVGYLRTAGGPPGGGREVSVRHARKDGRSVAVLRVVDYGDRCTVQADVYPSRGGSPTQAGPYSFVGAREATAFVNEAVEALTFLGCDVE